MRVNCIFLPRSIHTHKKTWSKRKWIKTISDGQNDILGPLGNWIRNKTQEKKRTKYFFSPPSIRPASDENCARNNINKSIAKIVPLVDYFVLFIFLLLERLVWQTETACIRRERSLWFFDDDACITKVVRDVHLTTFSHTDKHQVGPSVAIKRSKTLSNQLDSWEEKETMNITTATFTFGRQRAM